MENIIIKGYYKVKRIGKHYSEAFKKIKKGEVITLSVELVENSETKKNKRLYMNDKEISTRTLYSALSHGLAIEEIVRKRNIVTVDSTKEQERNKWSYKRRISELEGKIEAYKRDDNMVSRQLLLLKEELIKAGRYSEVDRINYILNNKMH